MESGYEWVGFCLHAYAHSLRNLGYGNEILFLKNVRTGYGLTQLSIQQIQGFLPGDKAARAWS
jgi:hypothetical protein